MHTRIQDNTDLDHLQTSEDDSEHGENPLQDADHDSLQSSDWVSEHSDNQLQEADHDSSHSSAGDGDGMDSLDPINTPDKEQGNASHSCLGERHRQPPLWMRSGEWKTD